MALAVSPVPTSSTLVDPTATLQTALANFESVLTTEQNQKFRDQVEGYNQERLDTMSVVQFVAQIDAENHAKTRMSVSPRLCTFLDATRQFTNIVDSFVSSNPAIAALVWGGIKTAILSASNVGSYFDKVTKTIMIVGKMCPLYREFSNLYSDSTTLQQALCDYYAIVVKLITRIVQVSQRTGISGMVSSVIHPFEVEFGPFQDDLAEASRSVELQISLAAKQAAHASTRLVELERRDNKQRWKLARKFVSEVRAEHDVTQRMRLQESARKAAELKLYVKDQLSTIQPQIMWRRAQKQRMTNTAEWFHHEHDFHAWKAGRSTATLWCPGRMGVGKTILVSNIIAYLHTILRADVISYHFCCSDDSATLTARNILGTLARQILDRHIENIDSEQLQELLDVSQLLDADDVVELLQLYMDTNRRYYVIVDGLDECSSHEIELFSIAVTQLCQQEKHCVKFLFSGRPELESQLFFATRPRYRLPLSKSMVAADIEHYIDTELDYCLQTRRIKLANPEAILSIRDVLHAENDGLLLFVRLFIEELCMLGNESAILKALDRPPRTISDLYRKSLHRTRAHDHSTDAIKVLQYCGCAKRPLTVDEFSELLSMSVTQTSLDHASVPQNMDQIIASCCGLVYVEEEEATVHYVHHSLKHHLFIHPSTHQDEFVESEIDVYLGHLCLVYLDFNDFKRQLKKVNAVSNTVVTPLGIGLASIRDSSGMVNEFARKLLRTHRSLQPLTMGELSRRTEDLLSKVESSRVRAEQQSRPFHLLPYARSNWLGHSSRFQEDSEGRRRFSACVRGENDLALKPWDQNSYTSQSSDVEPMSCTEWALHNNHAALMLFDVLREPCLLMDDQIIDILRYAVMSDNQHLTAAIMRRNGRQANINQIGLSYAAGCGSMKFVELFIEAGAIINGPNTDSRTALQMAADGGHLEVVERLLSDNADPNAFPPPIDDLTALQAAAAGGHLEVVERLLAADADVNAAAAVYSGKTALQAAADGGHLAVVELLLAANADANAETCKSHGRTALQGAAEHGHLDVVERLLKAGANVNALPVGANLGRTALQAAAGGGHLDIVERLLEAQANVNGAASPNGHGGRTALQAAAEKGFLQVIERLLSAGADVNAPATEWQGCTALQAAAGGGFLELVERLLAAKADVNAAAVGDGRTALQAAAENGHLEVVDRLLDAGADVNATASASYENLHTALQMAAEMGHLEVVKRLLAANANFDAFADLGEERFALQMIVEKGHVEVAECLKSAGAGNGSASRHNV